MKNGKYIDGYFSGMEEVIRDISRESIDSVVELLFEAWKNERTVFIFGNGGSASTATHFASDLAKSTIVDGKKRFRAIGLTDNIPLVSAWTNDSGFESIFSEQLKNLIRRGDVVIAISVHGGKGRDKAALWSQNLIRAIQLAKDYGCKSIGFSGFDGGLLKEMADACIVVPSSSTQHVESFHMALEHLICGCLREKIEKEPAKLER